MLNRHPNFGTKTAFIRQHSVIWWSLKVSFYKKITLIFILILAVAYLIDFKADGSNLYDFGKLVEIKASTKPERRHTLDLEKLRPSRPNQ